jgi:hypothetical protein
MEEKPVTIKDSVTVIEEIQSKLEHMLTRRKADIERDLEERIRAEKAEADKKLEAIQKELDKGRGILEDYRSVVNEYETERTSLQGQIKEHFDKAVAFQTEIERMAGLTLEELRYVSDLTAKLDTIHVAAEEKVNGFRKDIEERFGIVAQLPPETPEEMDLKVDLEQELAKLRKIKELLEAEPGELTAETVMSPGRAKVPVAETFELAASGVPEPEPEPATVPETFAETSDAGDPLNLPEINQVMEQTLAREGEAEEAAGAAEESAPLPDKANWAEEKENFQALFEVLERFRKVEPKNGNGEISYFCKDDRIILDGEHMIASIDEAIEEAKRLYAKLTQTESPKEQFFIKQEIINFQEVLRKYVLRNVKLCEREGAVLPQFTADILNLDLLKEILEKLSMENWSNPAEFSGFQTMVESLKDAYYAKITPPALYLKSLIRELGA